MRRGVNQLVLVCSELTISFSSDVLSTTGRFLVLTISGDYSDFIDGAWAQAGHVDVAVERLHCGGLPLEFT